MNVQGNASEEHEIGNPSSLEVLKQFIYGLSTFRKSSNMNTKSTDSIYQVKQLEKKLVQVKILFIDERNQKPKNGQNE
jgi:hypothetical protein